MVVAEAVNGQLQYRAVNSCIKPAHAIDGLALWTAADLAQRDGTLHPVQQAMVDCHGSQCGFCTPGFLMLATWLLERETPIDEAELRHVLSSNLCRCTGYQNIVKSVQQGAAAMASA